MKFIDDMLSEIYSKYKIIDQLLLYNYRFAIYKLPNSKKIHFILQTNPNPNLYQDFFALDNKEGFLIAPFSVSELTPIILILPDIELHDENEIFHYLESQPWDNTNSYTSSTNKDKGLNTYLEYKYVFEIFHNAIENKKVNKLVLSRTKDLKKSQDLSIGLIFHKAIEKYSNNFVYLCNTPESGAWIGSSPEILLSGEGKQYKTHALAGTQRIISKNEPITWDNKNLQEQAVVFNYIRDILMKVGIDAIGNTPKTTQSGDLAHLKSDFLFEINNKLKIGELLDLLHPTPAVCGFPKNEAFDIIIQNEGYNRSYYSGFIGPYRLRGNTNLYVNLRCMQIFQNSLRLYAGGGLMDQSKVDEEWKETEYKLQTISSIL